VNCVEFKEQVEAYALGALDSAERTACDDHLKAAPHDGCMEALDRARKAVQLLTLSLDPVKPGDDVWRAISERIGAPAATTAQPGRVVPWPWMMAVAALVVATVFVGRRAAQLEGDLASARGEAATAREGAARGAVCQAELDKLRADLSMRKEALALLERPGTQMVHLQASKGMPYRATALMNVGEKRAYLLGQQLGPQTGKDYQLWMIRGDQKISAGVLRASADGAVVAAIEPAQLAAGAPDALAVTVEPSGGVPQPTGPIVLVAPMPKT
jgi:anti-sigma-K factor RskA